MPPVTATLSSIALPTLSALSKEIGNTNATTTARLILRSTSALSRQVRNDALATTTAPLVLGKIAKITEGWLVVFATLITLLPWGIVSVWDAIDGSYRSRRAVACRLALSTFCLFVAYLVGVLFTVILSIKTEQDKDNDRHDEIAAVLVLLVFNLWHVARNVRGWLQFFALNKLRPWFERVQSNFANSFLSCYQNSDSDVAPSSGAKNASIVGLSSVYISNRLIDNDWSLGTPFLNPLANMYAIELDPRLREHWAGALWRAWWSQNTNVVGAGSGARSYIRTPNMDVPEAYRCDRSHRYPGVQNLMDTDPSARESPEGYRSGAPNEFEEFVVDNNNQNITKKEQWANCLLTYGASEGQEPEGQQDTHGDRLEPYMDVKMVTAVAILVAEKRDRIPNRMSALWYDTACFEEVYRKKARDCERGADWGYTVFPSWSKWLHIAQDIAVNLERPVYLSDTQLTNYAGELASASLILVRYPDKYPKLVRQIYQDGINARWTFGWSGLLACFTHLWTEERVYIAMLNGLSLLALDSVDKVPMLDANVRSMLYGYAAFEVSDRAVGKTIAEDRSAELLRRYLQNKGKTCRGSGVCATRAACRTLGLPAEASHMDGLPAFSTGWASEYMEHLPGNQVPSHGGTHDEVEAIHGSSNAWRYPYCRA